MAFSVLLPERFIYACICCTFGFCIISESPESRSIYSCTSPWHWHL